jgi:hypothetical protein
LYLVTVALVIAGLVLLVGSPFVIPLAFRGRRDPTGVIRIVQLVGVALLVVALFSRPYHPDTAAVPPPPDAPRRGSP